MVQVPQKQPVLEVENLISVNFHQLTSFGPLIFSFYYKNIIAPYKTGIVVWIFVYVIAFPTNETVNLNYGKEYYRE